jgi:hypothetical protein
MPHGPLFGARPDDHAGGRILIRRSRQTGDLAGISLHSVVMSTKRLTPKEKARYLIGVAVMRQIEEAPRDPDTVAEIDAVGRWLEHWLTPDELAAVMEATGLIFDDDLADELFNPQLKKRSTSEPPDTSDDGSPF